VLGRLCRGMGTIFVDRERRSDVARAGREILAALDRGDGVVLFAEGTSTAGAGVAPFRSSLLEPAAARRMPVYYASITYRTPAGAPPAHRAVCWWGDMPFASHLFALFGLGAFDAVVRFGPEPVADVDRKRLAARLRERVAERFTPVVSPEAL